MSFEQLVHLRKLSAAWRLLASDSAAFVASFLYKSFLQTNRRAISSADLVDELDNFIYFIKQKYPEHAPSRSAKEYIEIRIFEMQTRKRFVPPSSVPPNPLKIGYHDIRYQKIFTFTKLESFIKDRGHSIFFVVCDSEFHLALLALYIWEGSNNTL